MAKSKLFKAQSVTCSPYVVDRSSWADLVQDHGSDLYLDVTVTGLTSGFRKPDTFVIYAMPNAFRLSGLYSGQQANVSVTDFVKIMRSARVIPIQDRAVEQNAIEDPAIIAAEIEKEIDFMIRMAADRRAKCHPDYVVDCVPVAFE